MKTKSKIISSSIGLAFILCILAVYFMVMFFTNTAMDLSQRGILAIILVLVAAIAGGFVGQVLTLRAIKNDIVSALPSDATYFTDKRSIFKGDLYVIIDNFKVEGVVVKKGTLEQLEDHEDVNKSAHTSHLFSPGLLNEASSLVIIGDGQSAKDC